MFKLGDLLLYGGVFALLVYLGLGIFSFKNLQGGKIEIYVNNKLYRVEKLRKEKIEFIVPTKIGGIKVSISDEKVRVLESNSPKKIIVKQGVISKVGEVLIGVPDEVLIKVVGESDLDYIVK